MLNVSAVDVVPDPFPHIAKQPFLDPELYERLKREFPPDEFFGNTPSVAGRSGRDLYRGDPRFDEFMKSSPAWNEFHAYLNSEEFMMDTFELFGEHLEKFGCSVDSTKAHFNDYVQTRETFANPSAIYKLLSSVKLLRKVKRKLFPSDMREEQTNELYARLDMHQGGTGYGKVVHCDHRNRLASMVIYFCDADALGIEGGDLSLYEHVEKKPYSEYERTPEPDKIRKIATVRPRDNEGVFFLCCNNSYHGVSPTHVRNGYRNFVYINISSKAQEIW